MPDPPSPARAPRGAYVVAGEWRAKPGRGDRVAAICDELATWSREEPGNLCILALRSSADRLSFWVYEEYVDRAAYETHIHSQHFARLAALLLNACEPSEASARMINLSPAMPHGEAGRTAPTWSAGRHAGSALRALVEGAHTDAEALDRVVGSAVVLDLTPSPERTQIDTAALDRAESRLRSRGERIRRGDILLLRTDWTERATGSPKWFRNSPSLSDDAARWLIAHRPSCLGCDFFEPDAPLQRRILANGIPLVDGLVNFAALPPRCDFFAPFCDFGAVRKAHTRAFAWALEAA